MEMRAIEGDAANPTQRLLRPIPLRTAPIAEHVIASARELQIHGTQAVFTAVFQTHRETDEFLNAALEFVLQRRVRQLILAHSESRLVRKLAELLYDLRCRVQVVQCMQAPIDRLDPPFSLVLCNHRAPVLTRHAAPAHPCEMRVWVKDTNLRPHSVDLAVRYAQGMHASLERVHCSGIGSLMIATPWFSSLVSAMEDGGFARIEFLRIDLSLLSPKSVVLYTQNCQLVGSNPEFLSACREIMLWNTQNSTAALALWMQSETPVSCRLLAFSIESEPEVRLLDQKLRLKSLSSIESWIVKSTDILVLNEMTRILPHLSLRPVLARLVCNAPSLSQNDVSEWYVSVIAWLQFLSTHDSRLKTLIVERAHTISDADLREIVASGLHLVRVAMQNRAFPTSMIRDPTLRLIAAAFRAGVHQIDFYSSITHTSNPLSVSEL